jgi:type II secretory pathway component PulJ
MKTYNLKRQNGASLMEVLVAMSISLVVTASMVALMANSLGNTARIIKMTKLSDDLRVAMQMMSRDVRRSSYNSNAMFCYGNEDCGTDGSVTLANDIAIVDGSCFWFEFDYGMNGNAMDDRAGGFRLQTEIIDDRGDEDAGNDVTVGWLEMYTGGTQPTCNEDPESGGWVAITNKENMNITQFSVDDDLSYTEVVLQDVNGNSMSQKVRKIRMNMRGELVMDSSVWRSMQDIVSVRNDLMIL